MIMVEKYQSLIRSVVMNLAGKTTSMEDIDDIVQNINIKLLDGAAKYNPERGTEEMFISMISRTTTIDKWRGNTRQHALFSSISAPSVSGEQSEQCSDDTVKMSDDSLNALELMLKQEKYAELENLLEHLKQDDRDFLMMCLCEEYDIRQCACGLGITEAALRVRKHRLLTKLKALSLI